MQHDKLPACGIQKIEIDLTRFEKEPDSKCLPILPTRNLVMFPYSTVTFELTREASASLAEWANENAEPIGIVCQINPEEDNPSITGGLYNYGVVADVLSCFQRPDGVKMALVRSRGRFRILGKSAESDKPWLCARVKLLKELEVNKEDSYIVTLLNEINERKQGIVVENPMQGMPENDDVFSSMALDAIAMQLPLEPAQKIDLLSSLSIKAYAEKMLTFMSIVEQRVKIDEDIKRRTKATLDENQRQAYLHQQMETIRETLYGDGDEIEELLEKAKKAKMPRNVMTLFEKETEKLRRYNPTSPDYSILYSYLDTLLALPWHKQSPPTKSLEEARNILEEDHYGLEKVKERIVEQLALMFHNPTGKAPILCLVGAPGVGKTSIGRSVARAMGRKYERVSFGGLHDESEIRGHRRTYIGAMPGRIIDAMKRASVVNPVLLLDEIDKIGADYKGDPSAALLEVLDPQQNCHFHDNYIDVDYDLSNVLFIATANTLSTIPRPLLDRMEIIDIPGYLLEEKVEIAKRHLIPRLCAELRLTPEQLNISDEAIADIITKYTAESGVRSLEKKLAAVGRKAVLALAEGKAPIEEVKPEHLYDLLGLAPHIPDRYEGNDIPGVVTGLAWTEVGGEILMVESSLSPSKTPTLTLTGKLGEVMKESASIAYQWVKTHCEEFGIDYELFDRHNLHVHFPEGAIPKDGPSAGITIATSIVSTFLQAKVRPRVAMTGEITLRGRVLPVGGIREKILAAKRAGITDIIMSADNKRDIDDMPEKYTRGLNFTFVTSASEVIKTAVII